MTGDERVLGGRYRLGDRIASGGMGTVWRAEDLLLGRAVAVKEVVAPPGASRSEAEVLRERTRREARSAARLSSPHAVTIFDVVEEDGRPWLVMELVEACTLSRLVSENGPLRPEQVARVGLAVLSALEAAHAVGIVHRDVKPSNVLVRGDGRVVLTDFGIATSTEDESLTATGLLVGSPGYIAPERLRGDSPGPASDLWSLGATLFTAVEGRPPYEGADAFETVQAVASGQRPQYRVAGPLVPVLDGLLEPDPARRLTAPSARHLLQRITEAADQQTQVLALPPTLTSTTPLPQPDPEARQQAGDTAALDLARLRRGLAEPAAGAAAGAGAGAAAAGGAGAAAGAGVGAAATASGSAGTADPGGTRDSAGPADSGGTGAGPAPVPGLPRPVRVRPELAPRRDRRGPALLAGLTALLLLAGGAAWAVTRLGGPDATPSARTTAGSSAPATTPTPGDDLAGTPAPPDEEPAQDEARPPETSAPAAGRTPTAEPEDDEDQPADETRPPSRSPATTAAPAGAAAGEVPDGWRRYRSDAGWTVAVPPGWTRTRAGEITEYRDRSAGRLVRVETGTAAGDAVADRRRAARSFARRHPTYREITLGPAEYRGFPTADWEFTYEGRRVLNRVFVVDDRGYSLWLQAREGDFEGARADLEQVVSTFRPARS